MALLRPLLFFCFVLGLAGGAAHAANKPAEKPPATVDLGTSENVMELNNPLSP
jgi:hypothetical protein